MIDMNQVTAPGSGGYKIPEQPTNQIPTQAPTVPYQDVGGGQNIIGQQPMLPTQPQAGQNFSVQSITPSPVDNLYKYADYGKGLRPKEWTAEQFPEQYRDVWSNIGAHIYRDPSWPSHMTWNPYYGFMDYGAILDALKGGYTGPGIQGMPGFERMGAEWWEDYNPEDIFGEGYGDVWKFRGDTGGGGGDDGSGLGWDWSNIWNEVDPNWSQGWMEGGTMEPTSFPYPSQWDTSSDILTQFAQGMPMTIPQSWRQAAGLGQEGIQTGFQQSAPWAWQQAQQMANEAGKTGYQQSAPWAWTRSQELANQMAKQEGKSVGQDPWYEQAKSVAQTDIEDAIKQAAEQAGLSGLRWSTPMGRSAQDIAGRTMANVGLEWTGRELDALENARAREMAATNQLLQLGQGIAGLGESARDRMMQAQQNLMGIGQGVAGLGENARNRQLQYGSLLNQVGSNISGLESQQMDRMMQAAGMLPGLGQMYLQAPQDWAQQAYQMGAGMTQLGQTALDRSYQDWLRQLPENSPWLQQAMAYAGIPSNMVPQQYQPSFFSQLLGGASSLIPGIGLLNLFNK